MDNIMQVKKECFKDTTYCEISDICKQLKAKGQECEDLNKQLISFMNGDYCANSCSLKQQLDQLKAENIKFTLESRKLIAQYSAKLERLEQTLAEIKEIAESCGWNFGSEILYKRIEQILQKISEVIDDKNS